MFDEGISARHKQPVKIGWFPGHMNKTRRLLIERIRKCDLVLEVLDARLPSSSQNPMLGQIRGDTPCLRVLTKPDLADPAVTQKWLLSLERTRMSAIELQATDQKSVKRLVQACKKLVPRRGSHGLPVRVMIAGIPNVGKSTIFNLLAGKKKAIVRNMPAVTRMEQSILTQYGLSLVDTPGVLWPRLDDQRGAYRLATSGAIGIGALDPIEVARFAVTYLLKTYPEAIPSRYPIEVEGMDTEQALEAIAISRGFLQRGGVPDRVKTAELVLRELRAGRLGRISFELPRISKRRSQAETETSEELNCEELATEESSSEDQDSPQLEQRQEDDAPGKPNANQLTQSRSNSDDDNSTAPLPRNAKSK